MKMSRKKWAFLFVAVLLVVQGDRWRHAVWQRRQLQVQVQRLTEESLPLSSSTVIELQWSNAWWAPNWLSENWDSAVSRYPHRLTLRGVGSLQMRHVLRQAANVRTIQHVEIIDGALTDEDLVWLGRLNLRTLTLEGSPGILGDGLRHIAHLGDLDELSLSGTSVDDASLIYLSELSSLQKLDLSHTRVSRPDRIDPLRQLPNLIEIKWDKPKPTDVSAMAH